MPDTTMCKDEFLMELRKKSIPISKIPTTGNSMNRWLFTGAGLCYWASVPDISVLVPVDAEKMTSVLFSIGISSVDCISRNYALVMINNFGVESPPPPTEPKKSYLDCSSSPSGAGIWLKKILIYIIV